MNYNARQTSSLPKFAPPRPACGLCVCTPSSPSKIPTIINVLTVSAKRTIPAIHPKSAEGYIEGGFGPVLNSLRRLVSPSSLFTRQFYAYLYYVSTYYLVVNEASSTSSSETTKKPHPPPSIYPPADFGWITGNVKAMPHSHLNEKSSKFTSNREASKQPIVQALDLDAPAQNTRSSPKTYASCNALRPIGKGTRRKSPSQRNPALDAKLRYSRLPSFSLYPFLEPSWQ